MLARSLTVVSPLTLCHSHSSTGAVTDRFHSRNGSKDNVCEHSLFFYAALFLTVCTLFILQL